LPQAFQSMVKAKVAEYGEGVRLEQVSAATNDQGWRGYMARFVFADINDVSLTASMNPEEEQDGPSFSFAFTPGDTAELRLVPSKEAAEALAVEDAPHMPEGMEGMDDAMAAMMMPMMQGMRVAMYVRVEGEIVESDATFTSVPEDNMVTLMYVNFDELIQHPDAMSTMMANDPRAIYKLQDAGAPGVRVEKQDQPVTIRFR